MMFQQPESPNRVNTFMDKFGLPIITLTIGTVLAAIIIAIWVGNIRVVDFNWLMLILGCLLHLFISRGILAEQGRYYGTSITTI
jgi:hypothetical protein